MSIQVEQNFELPDNTQPIHISPSQVAPKSHFKPILLIPLVILLLLIFLLLVAVGSKRQAAQTQTQPEEITLTPTPMIETDPVVRLKQSLQNFNTDQSNLPAPSFDLEIKF